MRLLFLLLMLFVPHAAHAQNHNAYCDHANSTAAFQNCVKRHHAAVQDTLNTVYEELAATLEGEPLDILRELQQQWVEYRDKECAWETMRIETESLVKVYELSCQARMTEARANLLKAALGNEETEAQSELSSFPRWMNALTADYPDVFWRFGERKRVDLNCDGTEEVIMIGAAISRLKALEVSEENIEDDREGRTPQAMDIVVSVTGNPPTGRPQSQIFRLPVTETLEGPHLCDTKASLKHYETELAEDESQSCLQRIDVITRQCPPVTLFWNGKDYEVAMDEAEKETEE